METVWVPHKDIPGWFHPPSCFAHSVDSWLSLKALLWLAFAFGLNTSSFYKWPESSFLASCRVLSRQSLRHPEIPHCRLRKGKAVGYSVRQSNVSSPSGLWPALFGSRPRAGCRRSRSLQRHHFWRSGTLAQWPPNIQTDLGEKAAILDLVNQF